MITLTKEITTREAAKILGVNQSRVRQFVKQGRLSVVKQLNCRLNLLNRKEVEAMAKIERKVGPPKKAPRKTKVKTP